MKLTDKALDHLFDAIDSAGLEYREYSGRGMCGQQCLGICFDDNAIGIVIDIIQYLDQINNEYENILYALKRAKEDSMGRGGIVYWPSIEVPENRQGCDE